MAKKHKHPEHENLERWLVSYADFITLLFATFTALYAMSQSDMARMKDVAAAIRQGFAEQSIMHGIKSIIQGHSPPTDNPNPMSKEQGAGDGVIGNYENLTYTPGEVKKMEETIRELQTDITQLNNEIQKLNQQVKQHAPSLEEDAGTPLRPIEMSVQERGIRVSFDSRLMFEPGSATLRKESIKALDQIASRLKKYDNTHIMHIEGHTDDLGIATAIFPSNWELSSARSSAVVRHLIRNQDFNPKSLVVVGYGESRPLTTNMTPEGRAKNRRVDIIIHSRQVSEQINPTLQFMKEKTLIRAESYDPNESKPNQALIRSESSDKSPIKVIVKDQDGVEKVIVPATKKIVPDIQPDMGSFSPKSTTGSDKKADKSDKKEE